MIKQGEINKLPTVINYYVLVKLVLLITPISFPLAVFGVRAWFTTWYILILLIGLPAFVFLILRNKHTSFLIDNNKVMISWGIVIKKSRSIMLNNIQNVATERGLLMSMFGIVILRIWSASQSQVVRGKNGNFTKPDGLLMLKKEDSEWLSEFISNSNK